MHFDFPGFEAFRALAIFSRCDRNKRWSACLAFRQSILKRCRPELVPGKSEQFKTASKGTISPIAAFSRHTQPLGMELPRTRGLVPQCRWNTDVSEPVHVALSFLERKSHVFSKVSSCDGRLCDFRLSRCCADDSACNAANRASRGNGSADERTWSGGGHVLFGQLDAHTLEGI
jgi:hypothetical protein